MVLLDDERPGSIAPTKEVIVSLSYDQDAVLESLMRYVVKLREIMNLMDGVQGGDQLYLHCMLHLCSYGASISPCTFNVQTQDMVNRLTALLKIPQRTTTRTNVRTAQSFHSSVV